MVPEMLAPVETRADPGFNAIERTNKALSSDPFNNTSEADEVSLEVEVGVVVGLKFLQPRCDTDLWSQYLLAHLIVNIH